MKSVYYSELKPGDIYEAEGELRLLLAQRVSLERIHPTATASPRMCFLVLVGGTIHEDKFWHPDHVKVRVVK